MLSITISISLELFSPCFCIHIINIHTTFIFYFWCLQRSVILLGPSICISMFLNLLC
jgi:hypothetical protein